MAIVIGVILEAYPQYSPSEVPKFQTNRDVKERNKQNDNAISGGSNKC